MIGVEFTRVEWYQISEAISSKLSQIRYLTPIYPDKLEPHPLEALGLIGVYDKGTEINKEQLLEIFTNFAIMTDLSHQNESIVSV